MGRLLIISHTKRGEITMMMIDPLYLMIFLVVGLIIVVGGMAAIMFKMVGLLEGIKNETRKQNAARANDTTIRVVTEPIMAIRFGESGYNLPVSGTRQATDKEWPNDDMDTTATLPRVKLRQ